MINIAILPAAEYPSKPVPEGHVLYRIDGLEDCAVIIGCLYGDEHVLPDLRFPRNRTHYKLRADGTECLVIHLGPHEMPELEATELLVNHIRERPQESMWLTMAPHQALSTIPYREVDE